ncbi:NADP-dependent dehydrogenase-like protein [Parathielavia hyrcaniae]|uniref:NADP-dependent dehydrogenase-like protein n=1 Tax=Parathielavia hyrcaniae TaxID=113614 RepID=A0AAN6PWX3_9PEZI|nr:NADP-dependent dehydrogenase-like protein [Parathielavia hyrcaniae]
MPIYVVTGARVGIGLGYIHELSHSPANTVFALVRSLTGDLNALRAIQAKAKATVHILECDISSPDSIAALPSLLTAQIPNLQIDVLINNAAVLHSREETALNLTAATLQSHMTSNVLGPAFTLQALLPLLSPTARVVNTTSGIASMAMVLDRHINAEITPYSISKAALNMLTVHQARQLREGEGGKWKGVVVVCVDPGHVKTEMGGPKASVEVEDSARGTLGVIAGLREEHSGKFLHFQGGVLEW